MPSFTNPIAPGFNPDPSIVLVNDIFYLVTSSFLAFPAIPIYASHDLINWEQIGNVVTRNSQLDMSDYYVNHRGESGGVWAPTIRYHDNKFWVIVTCVRMGDSMEWDEHSRFRSYIWHCTDPFEEEWSEPIRFNFPGFDTSLFWDDDGKAYIQGSQSYKSYDHRQISGFEVDLNTGKNLSGPEWTTKFMWDGTGGIFTEAPHIFKRGEWYYLLVAEGGTYLGHSACVARSKSLFGPYENCPKNPVLRRPPPSEYVQTIGHADFTQDGNGSWWALALGTRIWPKDKSSPMGRETYLIPGTWKDNEWPIWDQPVKINMSSDNLPASRPLTRRGKFQHVGPSLDMFCSSAGASAREEVISRPRDEGKVDHERAFLELAEHHSPSAQQAREKEKELAANRYKFSPHWVHVRNPDTKAVYIVTSPLTMSMTPGRVTLSDQEGSPSFVGRRQTSEQFMASVVLGPGVGPMGDKVEAGLTVFLDGIRHAEVYLHSGEIGFRSTTMGARGVTEGVAPLSRKHPHVEQGGSKVRYTPNTRVKLIARTGTASDGRREFVLGFDGGHGETVLGRVEQVELSVGFTGVIVGMYAVGEPEPVLFSDFKYTPMSSGVGEA